MVFWFGFRCTGFRFFFLRLRDKILLFRRWTVFFAFVQLWVWLAYGICSSSLDSLASRH